MPEQITIGSRRFDLRRPNLGQLRGVLDALNEMSGALGGVSIDAAIQIILAGLKPSEPDLTAEALLNEESSVAELNAAVTAVVKMAGLEPKGEAAPQPAA
jgi:hypothetical protein